MRRWYSGNMGLFRRQNMANIIVPKRLAVHGIGHLQQWCMQGYGYGTTVLSNDKDILLYLHPEGVPFLLDGGYCEQVSPNT